MTLVRKYRQSLVLRMGIAGILHAYCELANPIYGKREVQEGHPQKTELDRKQTSREPTQAPSDWLATRNSPPFSPTTKASPRSRCLVSLYLTTSYCCTDSLTPIQHVAAFSDCTEPGLSGSCG